MKPGMILYREELQMLLMMEDGEIAEAITLLANRFLFGDPVESDNRRVKTFLRTAVQKQEADEAAYEKRVDSARKAGLASNDSRTNAQRPSTDVQRPFNDRSTTVDDCSTTVNKQEQEQEQEHRTGTGTNTNMRTSARVFVKPTLEQVRSYCQQRGNSVDPQEFMDFYESKGWMIGKNHMKDWQACVRTWEKNRFGQETKKSSEQNMKTHDWNYDELEELAWRRAGS